LSDKRYCWYVGLSRVQLMPTVHRWKNHLDDTTSRHNIQFSTSFSTLEVTSVLKVIAWTFLITLYNTVCIFTESLKLSKWCDYQSCC